MRVADFDFALPERLIAQAPRPRGAARLLVVDRAEARFAEASVADLPTLLDPGDLLVVNDTRVFPARLLGRREPSGGAVECLLLERETSPGSPAGPTAALWQALVHPGQKLKVGARMRFEDPARAPGIAIEGEILARRLAGRRLVRLEAKGAPSLEQAVDALGHVPLPPYIDRPDTAADRERYQTVFARARGSVAAPTAGLHFDEALLARIRAAGVAEAHLTLHVGYGTFKPVRVATVDEHTVDPEPFEIPAHLTAAVGSTHASGGRVVAVGTTTTRALESAATGDHQLRPGPGRATLFIHPATDAGPGHTFQVVDALLTNFHLPQSSLLMLVCAFAGRELILAAYREAVSRGFHFYSYGDAMLIR